MRWVWMLAVAAFLWLPSVWAAPPDTGSPVPAVWKEQHLNFSYLGRTSRYSCDGLRDKIRALLLDLGARRDLRITTLGCNDAAPSARRNALGPSVALVFSSPALPQPIAPPLHAGDLAAVDARFEAFSIARDVFRNMDVADCELVEEFARQVLPKLTVRGVKEEITCVPNQLSGSRFLIRGDVLRALPEGEQPVGRERVKAP
jgi:hypothetical protein